MLVNDTTFATMRNAAQEIDWNGMRVFVPALDHLFALKFHALRHGPRSRQYKDFLDILSLAEINSVEVQSDRMRQICDKYGTDEIYERLVAFSS